LKRNKSSETKGEVKNNCLRGIITLCITTKKQMGEEEKLLLLVYIRMRVRVIEGQENLKRYITNFYKKNSLAIHICN
jgi:hypothetical protein